MSYQTPQETFWAGEFGTEYITRNRAANLLGPKIRMFSRILGMTRDVHSVFEIGPNVGLNLLAIRSVLPAIELNAIEINAEACREVRGLIGDNAVHGSILDLEPTRTFDFVFTSGVLIHIDPDSLAPVYDKMHAMSSRYIMVNEYYNPAPVEVTYRGQAGRLFKRDFCGDLLDRFADLELVDYGFTYRRDPIFPQDDCTWFLLRKR
jgi:spore coat polysaccharide biosynthesis protein SpsF